MITNIPTLNGRHWAIIMAFALLSFTSSAKQSSKFLETSGYMTEQLFALHQMYSTPNTQKFIQYKFPVSSLEVKFGLNGSLICYCQDFVALILNDVNENTDNFEIKSNTENKISAIGALNSQDESGECQIYLFAVVDVAVSGVFYFQFNPLEPYGLVSYNNTLAMLNEKHPLGNFSIYRNQNIYQFRLDLNLVQDTHERFDILDTVVDQKISAGSVSMTINSDNF